MILVLLVELKVSFRFLQLINIRKKITVNHVHDGLEWLKFVDDTKSTNAKASKKSCNWAAHYQENIVQELQIICSSVLLPLINERINSPAMVKLCITVIQNVVHKVNLGQIPQTTSDQPVYSLL